MKTIDFNKIKRAIAESYPNDQGCSMGYMEGNRPRIEADFEFIQENIDRDAAVLDIGGIPPLLAAMLRKKGFHDVSLIDPNVKLYDSYLNSNGICSIEGDLFQNVGVPRHFDLVCLNEVIEHLAGNLLEAISHAVALITPGGKLMVTTPNLRSVSGIIALLRYRSGLASKPYDTVRMQYERAMAKYGYYGHLREFTEKEVIDLIESFGMKHVKSSFQVTYLNRPRPYRLIRMLEYLLPKYRLFGKYLFEKPH